MSKESLIEIATGVALAALSFLLINPSEFWMPSMMQMSLLGGVLVVCALFAVFVLRESASDEREDALRSFSGRFAFLAGGLVLLIGIAAEDMRGHIDPWLVWSLIAMVFAKIAARLYSDTRL